MDHTPHLAWINDSNGILKYMNSAHGDLLNLKKEDIGKSLFDVLPHKIARESHQLNLEIIKDPKPHVSIQKMTHRDGSHSMYKVHRFPLFFNNETYVGGWAVDITQEDKLQKKLFHLLPEHQWRYNLV